jgi:hypothetical protein
MSNNKPPVQSETKVRFQPGKGTKVRMEKGGQQGVRKWKPGKHSGAKNQK